LFTYGVTNWHRKIFSFVSHLQKDECLGLIFRFAKRGAYRSLHRLFILLHATAHNPFNLLVEAKRDAFVSILPRWVLVSMPLIRIAVDITIVTTLTAITSDGRVRLSTVGIKHINRIISVAHEINITSNIIIVQKEQL
jgi:hypothetical protein